jgi:hypothetical protein
LAVTEAVDIYDLILFSIVGAACFGLAFLSLIGLREMFGKDLDFLEAHV